MKPRHAPFYCEENVWWLGREPALAEARLWIVFITNRRRTCAMRHQRAAAPGAWLVWDYHVVLLADAGAPEVWDLDCRLGHPLPLRRYLEASFDPRVPEPYLPRLRPVEADVFYASFASDRSHMRAEAGGWRKPPPPWPPIGDGSTLERFLDLDDLSLGPWCDPDELARAVRHSR